METEGTMKVKSWSEDIVSTFRENLKQFIRERCKHSEFI